MTLWKMLLPGHHHTFFLIKSMFLPLAALQDHRDQGTHQVHLMSRPSQDLIIAIQEDHHLLRHMVRPRHHMCLSMVILISL